MKYLKKISYLSVCLSFSLLFTAASFAQDRDRLVRTVSSQPVNAPAKQTDRTKALTSSRPINAPVQRPSLTNEISVIPAEPKSLVKKTGESRSTASMAKGARASTYAPSVTGSMMSGITSLLGLPYRYGSTGPNRYDCSGFVWQVFNNAGLKFERTSARSLWSMSEPVTGDDRYKFGTLVFMNNLGHMGIVADEKGFYHASSSKGITYSLFEGYWEKRIVGFRRLNLPQTQEVIAAETAK